MSLLNNLRPYRLSKRPSALVKNCLGTRPTSEARSSLVNGLLNREDYEAQHNFAYLKIGSLEEIFVADMVNLHAFMDEQSFGLLNHWTPST